MGFSSVVTLFQYTIIAGVLLVVHASDIEAAAQPRKHAKGIGQRMRSYRSGTRGLTKSSRQRLERLSKSAKGRKSHFKNNPDRPAFQDHHLIPHTHEKHHVIGMAAKAGFHINSRANKMLLPTTSRLKKADYRRTVTKNLPVGKAPARWQQNLSRSVHNGYDRFHKSRNEQWKRKLDKVASLGKRKGWRPKQYMAAVERMVARERQGLRSEQIQVNRDTR